MSRFVTVRNLHDSTPELEESELILQLNLILPMSVVRILYRV